MWARLPVMCLTSLVSTSYNEVSLLCRSIAVPFHRYELLVAGRAVEAFSTHLISKAAAVAQEQGAAMLQTAHM